MAELGAVFAEHRDFVARHVARRTADPHVVDDRVQEVFERIIKARDTRPVASWRALLLRVASTVIVDHVRRDRVRHARAHVSLETDDPGIDAAVDPMTNLVARQQLARLKGAVMALDPIERDIVLLARLRGLSHKEIAQRLGMEPVRVSRLLYRALARLAADVGEP